MEAGPTEAVRRDRSLQVGAAAAVVTQAAHDPARLAPYHEVRRRRCRALASIPAVASARACALACGRGGHRSRCCHCGRVHLDVEAVGDLAGKAALECTIHRDASRLEQRPNGCAARAVPLSNEQLAELHSPCRSSECGICRHRRSVHGRLALLWQRHSWRELHVLGRLCKWRRIHVLVSFAVLLHCRLHVRSSSARAPLEHVSALVHAGSALASRESVTADG